MKNIFILLAIAFSSASFAQGNLQFNQVVNFDYAVTLNSYTTSIVDTWTVPLGKIWKITSASVGRINDSHICIMRVNNHKLAKGPGSSDMSTPYWLGPGNHSVSIRNNGSITNAEFWGAVSIIEFNVVP